VTTGARRDEGPEGSPRPLAGHCSCRTRSCPSGRVVTEVDAEGTSVIVSDGQMEARGAGAVSWLEFHRLWTAGRRAGAPRAHRPTQNSTDRNQAPCTQVSRISRYGRLRLDRRGDRGVGLRAVRGLVRPSFDRLFRCALRFEQERGTPIAYGPKVRARARRSYRSGCSGVPPVARLKHLLARACAAALARLPGDTKV
jgi:hypothetical protein